MKKVIILNGPPGCGKDTLATHILHHYSRFPACIDIATVKAGLFEEVYEHFGIYTQEQKEIIQEAASSRVLKEEPHFLLSGMSPRQALIHVSEDICKPMYGNSYFGELAAQRIHDLYSEVVIFSDGGFIEEVSALAEENEVYVIGLHGRGDFEGDSRSYLKPFDVHSFGGMHHIVNLVEGDIAGAAAEIVRLTGI